MKKRNYPILESIESQVSEPGLQYHPSVGMMSPSVLMTVINEMDESSANDIAYLKDMTLCSDNTIANWLNINVKTYRTYRDGKVKLRPDIKEHLAILTALVKHGLMVMGSPEAFSKWLKEENFMLSNKCPSELLNTNSGVRMIDDRLTGIAFGDNA